MTKRTLIIATAAALLAVSCGGDDAQQAIPLTENPTPGPTPCLLDGASPASQARESGAGFQPVVDVRWSDEGCARVVFEFEQQVADYEIGYVDPPFADCASGDTVDTDAWGAGAFLAVRLEPSASVDLSGNLEETYTGSRDVSVSGATLRHLKVTCDFEGTFEWLVGLEEERPFSVVTFADPPRIVIDVSEGAT